MPEHPRQFIPASLVFLVAIFLIGNTIHRTESLLLFSTYVAAFGSSWFLVRKEPSFKLLVGLGILSRLLLFLSLPSLSNDVFRFIWDGTLLSHGINPFENLPSFYLDKNIPGLTATLYGRLNSPEYFTIYPPINQLIFWLSVELGGDSWLLSTNLMRAVLLLADVGSVWLLVKLLKHYQKPQWLANLYFLNPLVILEFTGNLHFEGLTIFFILGGIYLFQKNRKIGSGFSLGMAVGIKLLPFIYLPATFLKGLGNQKWLIGILAGVIGLLTLLPLLNSSFISGMSSSLDLYFRKFEFNASIYYLVREVGFWIYGYNKIASIGPLLSIISTLGIITISILGSKNQWELPKIFLFVLLTYLSFTTTVHPWYSIPLIAFGILSGYYFPIVWSLVIFVTYVGYTDDRYILNPIWIILEYAIVWFVMLMELKGRKFLLSDK